MLFDIIKVLQSCRVVFIVVTLCLCEVGCEVMVAIAAPHVIEVEHGAVVSDSAAASKIGVAVLKQGGNAVDAAIATALALAVSWPEAGNIGGGGFMLIHGRGGEVVCIDYRETAPAAAVHNMFELGENIHTSKAVGVPGTVCGLGMAHEKFGTLAWHDLVIPAVTLADSGLIVSDQLADSLNRILADAPDHAELQRVYGSRNGQPWRGGDRLIQKDLSRTLQRIAEHGPDAFYHGVIAMQLVTEMQACHGLITMQDLDGYRAKLRQPIHGQYRQYDIYGPPPPSSGGICLVMMLNILEHFQLRQSGRWSPRTLHLMTEVMRRTFADRARYLGDSDFVQIPRHLVTKEYAAKLADKIDLQQATRSAQVAPEVELASEGGSTTHFSIIDSAGMAVSNTYTLERSYGSRIVLRGAGFLLNNEMGDFNWKQGYTDRHGRIGTMPNRIAPGKRMLSSMTPVIVARNSRAVLVTGSPGGRTIINTVLCVLLNVLEFEMPLATAIRAPRHHHQWLPDILRYEGSKIDHYRSSLVRLSQMGHVIQQAGRAQGSTNTIQVEIPSGRRMAASDHRRAESEGAVGY